MNEKEWNNNKYFNEIISKIVLKILEFKNTFL